MADIQATEIPEDPAQPPLKRQPPLREKAIPLKGKGQPIRGRNPLRRFTESPEGTPRGHSLQRENHIASERKPLKIETPPKGSNVKLNGESMWTLGPDALPVLRKIPFV